MKKETGDGSLSPLKNPAKSMTVRRRQRTVPCLLPKTRKNQGLQKGDREPSPVSPCLPLSHPHPKKLNLDWLFTNPTTSFIIYTYLNPPIMYDRYVGVDNNYKKQHPEKFNRDNEILENNNGKIKNEN